MEEKINLSPIYEKKSPSPLKVAKELYDRVRIVSTFDGRKPHQLIADLIDKPLEILEEELGLTEVMNRLKRRKQ